MVGYFDAYKQVGRRVRPCPRRASRSRQRVRSTRVPGRRPRPPSTGSATGRRGAAQDGTRGSSATVITAVSSAATAAATATKPQCDSTPSAAAGRVDRRDDQRVPEATTDPACVEVDQRVACDATPSTPSGTEHERPRDPTRAARRPRQARRRSVAGHRRPSNASKPEHQEARAAAPDARRAQNEPRPRGSTRAARRGGDAIRPSTTFATIADNRAFRAGPSVVAPKLARPFPCRRAHGASTPRRTTANAATTLKAKARSSFSPLEKARRRDPPEVAPSSGISTMLHMMLQAFRPTKVNNPGRSPGELPVLRRKVGGRREHRLVVLSSSHAGRALTY